MGCRADTAPRRTGKDVAGGTRTFIVRIYPGIVRHGDIAGVVEMAAGNKLRSFSNSTSCAASFPNPYGRLA